MWELDYKESWAPKNWFFWTVVLEKTIESPLDYKEIQPVHHKGNQSWIFTGRTGAEAPILWPPDVKNWLIWKDPDAGKDWKWEEKGTTEDEMVGWHHRHNGHEFEEVPGFGDGQGSLSWTSMDCVLQSMGSQRVRYDWATELNWTELMASPFQFSTFQMAQVLTFPIMNDPPENWMFVNSYRNNYKKQNLFRKLLIKELGDDVFVLTVTDSVTLFKLIAQWFNPLQMVINSSSCLHLRYIWGQIC